MAGGIAEALRSQLRLVIRDGKDEEDFGEFMQEVAAIFQRLQNGGVLQWGHRLEIRDTVPTEGPQANQPNLILIDDGSGPHFRVWVAGTGWVNMATTSVPGDHAIDGSQHTAAGLTIGHFMKATAADAFAFEAHGLSHADLALLLADDHTQYALLVGRSGGQTLMGGIDASDNLTLQSTSHATRGEIVVLDLATFFAGIETDTIDEYGAGMGVTIDGVELKDGGGTFIALIDAQAITATTIECTELTNTAGRISNTTRATTTYQILVTDHVVFGNTDGAAWTATLPAGAEGRTLRVINSGSSGNLLTVAPNGAEHLYGANTNFTLRDGESIDITYNATDGWY